jgi:hypothetical protein
MLAAQHRGDQAVATYVICPSCKKPVPQGPQQKCTRCASSTVGGKTISESEAQALMAAQKR